MPQRPPLVPQETFVADLPQLSANLPGEAGLSTLIRAELINTDPSGVTLKAATADGTCLFAQVEAAGEGIIRVRLHEDPASVTRSTHAITLICPEPYEETIIEIDHSTVLVHAGPLTAQITLDPWQLRFLDINGRTLLAQDQTQQDASCRSRVLPFGRSHTDGEAVAYHECFTAAADEHFVGFGEKFTELDKRGQRPIMWHVNALGSESDRSYKNIPFYLSSRGYGVLVNSGTPVEFDVCRSNHSCVQIMVPDDLLDYFVLAGPTPARILDRYNRLTCRPGLPPKWAFGSWVSASFDAETQDDILATAQTLRERGIPSDVIHLGHHWQVDGHGADPGWDSDRFPDPPGMLSALAKLDFRTCLSINPYISHLSQRFAYGAKQGFFLRRASGDVHIASMRHDGFLPCGMIDFTNPAATSWFTGLLRPLLRQGVSAFATSLAETVPADAVASNGMTGVDLHNVYPLLFSDAVAAVTTEVAGHGMVWSRSSFTGGQRHAAQWSGDASSTYPAMGSTLRGGLSHGMSGMPFWSHDVGGSTGTPTPDLYVRWAQFGALSPLLRFHGMTSRLPWDFSANAEKAVIDAIRLRYYLLPYIYSAAVESTATGKPMLRPLLVDSPDDPAAWRADLEYRLGGDLLVAPMINPDGTRMIYLPAGEWVDHWTGTVHTGGRYIRVTPPLDRTPLLVRHGALISTVPVAGHVPDGPFSGITLISWGGRTSRSTIHDVDGATTITAMRSGDKFDVRTQGPAQIESVVFAFVHGAQPPRTLTLNGRELPIETR